jgi:hypothetical protein
VKAKVAAVPAAEVMARLTSINVLPTSPCTIRLAISGIITMLMENNRLARPMSVTGFDPTNAFRIVLFVRACCKLPICSAVINSCKIA